MHDDLRTLAQAVVDAHRDWTVTRNVGPLHGAWLDLVLSLGLPHVVDEWDDTRRTADAILAALNAERAQGYARAMGEVVERADHSADYTGWSDYALGHRDAHERLAVWARERLPAAAEKEHGG